MTPEYKVKQGDHLSSIAHEAGLDSYKALWNDGKNAALKDLRKNPNVLLPGDKVAVRKSEPKTVSAATEKHHKFKRLGTPLKLRLRLLSEPGKPAKGARCGLTVEGVAGSLTTNGEGIVETPIAPDAHSGFLIVDEHLLTIHAPLGIGELDPIDTASGQIGRLNNLGYFAGPAAEPADDAAKLRFRSAVEEFQCDYGLSVDGVCGPNTRKELEKAHGC